MPRTIEGDRGHARASIAPDMPTAAESRLPGCEVGNGYAILGPAEWLHDPVIRLDAAIKDTAIPGHARARAGLAARSTQHVR